MLNGEAQRIITALGLAPLPREGGWYKPTWRTPAGSAIYFLLTPADFSALHRLPQVEVWHFYSGDVVEHVQLDPGTGNKTVTQLGPDILQGHSPQLVAQAGYWQGARIAVPEHGWALVGCTLAPPWAEQGFELADRSALQRQFPAHAEVIGVLTR
jgi:predicted cupin superfamily sugar epimerase